VAPVRDQARLVPFCADNLRGGALVSNGPNACKWKAVQLQGSRMQWSDGTHRSACGLNGPGSGVPPAGVQ
jgi:hypothetical protein